MLTRTLAKRFSTKIYTWGWNFNNLGRHDPDDYRMGYNIPQALKIQDTQPIKKIVMGFSESIVLNQDGSYYNFGTKHVLPNNNYEPKIGTDINNGVKDVDLDYTHAIFLTKDGKILEQTSKGINTPDIQGNVHSVACGNGFSLAVIGNDYGTQKVMVWPTDKSVHNSVFCSEDIPNGPVEIKSLTKLIETDNTRIKKIKVVNNSIVVLLENGVLAAWGDNRTGNLGIPRSLLLMHDVYVENVKVPFIANHITDFVSDFDISSNNIIILSEKGDLYYAGRDKDLKLEKLLFFTDKKVASVGSFHNNYVIVTEQGEIFSTEPPKDEILVKYWGDYKLYQYDQSYFNKSKVIAVSGKYDNAYAITE